MARQPDTTVRMVDFPGMVEAADPNDLPPAAAALQVNASSVVSGRLTSRGGHLPLTYDATTTETV